MFFTSAFHFVGQRAVFTVYKSLYPSTTPAWYTVRAPRAVCKGCACAFSAFGTPFNKRRPLLSQCPDLRNAQWDEGSMWGHRLIRACVRVGSYSLYLEFPANPFRFLPDLAFHPGPRVAQLCTRATLVFKHGAWSCTCNVWFEGRPQRTHAKPLACSGFAPQLLRSMTNFATSIFGEIWVGWIAKPTANHVLKSSIHAITPTPKRLTKTIGGLSPNVILIETTWMALPTFHRQTLMLTLLNSNNGLILLNWSWRWLQVQQLLQPRGHMPLLQRKVRSQVPMPMRMQEKQHERPENGPMQLQVQQRGRSSRVSSDFRRSKFLGSTVWYLASDGFYFTHMLYHRWSYILRHDN